MCTEASSKTSLSVIETIAVSLVALGGIGVLAFVIWLAMRD